DHPLDNAIGNPSRPVLIRSQLPTHAIWCYFDAHGHPIPFGGKRFGRALQYQTNWMTFGGNTRDLGSFGEEMDEITTLHQSRRRKGHKDPRDGVTNTCDDIKTSKRRLPPNKINMDDLESEDELIDTPLISPFLDSDDESHNGEVLNELDEYENERKVLP
ncbi:hypothetical protein Tco_0591023, partial [Tanacetum coccineum]